jgi:hypothetical protein
LADEGKQDARGRKGTRWRPRIVHLRLIESI